MDVVDVIIILLILFGGVSGFKKGLTRQLVDTVGTIAVIILSFMLKGHVSGVLYEILPFFNFSGKFVAITAMNILLYEAVAFILVFIVLYAVLAFLKTTTTIFEKILKATIILGIPSKILGFFVGLVNNFVLVFIGLYFLNLPLFGLTEIQNSKISNQILTSTPVLSDFCDDTLNALNEMDKLMEEYETNPDRVSLNNQTLLLLIDSNIIDKETVNNLITTGKLKGATIIE